MSTDPLAQFYVTPAVAAKLQAETPPRYGIAHLPTSEMVVKGSKRHGHHVEERTGELLYAYDLKTGKPVKPVLKG